MVNPIDLDESVNSILVGLGWKVEGIKHLVGGGVGQIFAARIVREGKKVVCLVKISPLKREPSYDRESVDDRIYGARHGNLQASYDLLASKGISTYRLLSCGKTRSSPSFFFQIMSELSGNPITEILAGDLVQEVQLYRLAGLELAKLHCIKRPFESWAAQTKPYRVGYKAAFFSSLSNGISAIRSNGLLSGGINFRDLGKYVHETEREWSDSNAFVYSHTDGLQGMARYSGNRWQFTGHFDIEDYKFVDLRCVLAGFELGINLSGKQVPVEFWQAYKEVNAIDPTFNQFKNLFRLYYLCSWLSGWVASKDGSAKKPTPLIKKFQRAIADSLN